jgi:hypothetical protein
MSDAELVERFERADVAELHHPDHVRVAFAYLRVLPLLDAIGRFTAALRRFAAAQGKPRLYHETITWAFLFIIHERMQRTPGAAWETFIAENGDLLRWKPSVLERYYPAEVLQSELARRVFLLPARNELQTTNPFVDITKPFV